MLSSTVSIMFSRSTFLSTICKRQFSSGRKPYTPPPSYTEQVEKGVPLGKRKLYGRQAEGVTQAVIALSLLFAFIATPFLGKKLAKDEELRNKLESYGYNLYNTPKPREAAVYSKEEHFRDLITLSRSLRERAINDDFKPEKLDRMKFNDDAEFSDANIPSGWGRIDLEEDDEDDDEE